MSVKYVAFTMDVEAFSDTICLADIPTARADDMLDGVGRYARLLEKHSIRGTFFTVPSAAKKIPAELKRCIDMGHELALHGGLTHKVMDGMSPSLFRDEVKDAKSELERLLGVNIEGFRAPCFSITDEQMKVLPQLGFKYDSSRHMKASLPLQGVTTDGDMCEFSACTVRFFGMDYPISGGGFLRIPPRVKARSMVKRYIENGDFYLFYIHPFEAAGRPHPAIKGLNWCDRVYMRRNIISYLDEVERMILLLKKNGFEFLTLSKLADKMKTP